MLYFAAGKYKEDIAISISASHNPSEYNGLKMTKKGAIAIAGDTGIYAIRDIAVSDKIYSPAKTKGTVTKRNILDEWVEHVQKFINIGSFNPHRVVIDTGNGMAGLFLPKLEKHLPWKVERMFYDLDGTFPNHTPNPLKPENVAEAIEKVKSGKADFGLAFDGDGDRVFLIDETGELVSGTILTAIIADNLLQKNKGELILYNAIVGRAVPEVVKKLGGRSKRVRVGHSIIKKEMRDNNALFCGEHSGHYYFRDNYYADSAIIAALLVAELLSEKNIKLSDLVNEYDIYKQSGELNFEVSRKEEIMGKIMESHKSSADSVDELDGVSVWYKDWWFNVRPSNTEPVLRLNIEADSEKILANHTSELTQLIETMGGKKVS